MSLIRIPIRFRFSLPCNFEILLVIVFRGGEYEGNEKPTGEEEEGGKGESTEEDEGVAEERAEGDGEEAGQAKYDEKPKPQKREIHCKCGEKELNCLRNKLVKEEKTKREQED